MNDENLNNSNEDAKIIDDDSIEPSAGQGKPEDTPDAYQSIIESKDAQIAALIEHNNSLTQQINKLVRDGAQPNDGKPAQMPDTDQAAYNGFTGFNGEPVKQMDLKEIGRMLAQKDQ